MKNWRQFVNSRSARSGTLATQASIDGFSQARDIQMTYIYRGYYTVARRYEFYVRVARTISHE